MTTKDLKALQNIHRQMAALEKRDPADFALPDLEALRSALAVFSAHEDLEFRKIADIAAHLHPFMTIKHYGSSRTSGEENRRF